jgi:hypothetical protein
MYARALCLLLVALAACDRKPAQPPRREEPIMNSSPSTGVDKLPPQNGRGEGGTHKSDGYFNFSGRYEKLTGTIIVRTVPTDILGSKANLEISTEQGRVRAYVSDASGKKFYYIEATPGKPATATVDLIVQGDNYTFRLEAADGEARGVTYHVWRS